MTLLAWLFTFFKSSRLAGITSLKVDLRSGSAEEEYDREGVEAIGHSVHG